MERRDTGSLSLPDVLLVGRAFPDSQSQLSCRENPDVFQSALFVFFVGLTDKRETFVITMKRVDPSAHPGYTDFWRDEGFVVRLCEQVLEVQFLYFGVGCSLQNREDILLSKCSTLRKAAIISLMSVRPSVCPHGTP
jgi:hypothetical protein